MDKLFDCSMQYAARYIYKLPDAGNSGASRGSVSHDIFEVLGKNPRHKKIVDEVLINKTCTKSPGLWRLINIYAKKYRVADTDNLDLIDSFIYVGIKNEFFGPRHTIKVLTEAEFDFEVEKEEISYRLRGFIDKIYIVNDGNSIYCEIRDFKSSKAKFSGEKLTMNNQALIYQLATRHLVPDFEPKKFSFLFIKFPQKPVQEISLYDKHALYGYELYLTEVQKRIDEFSIENQADNFAALDPKKKWLCGKEGFKDTGEKHFMCGSRKPFDYYVVKKDGEIIKSGFKESDIKLEEGEKAELMRYPGCLYFYNKDGKPRTGSV